MSLVNFEVDGAVAVVTLNRPPVNALSEELSNDLLEAFEKCQDDSIRAVVVTGEPHFAAGADIKGFKVSHESGTDDTLARALVVAAWVLERLEKPTIAAVRGYALGGGLEHVILRKEHVLMARDEVRLVHLVRRADRPGREP